MTAIIPRKEGELITLTSGPLDQNPAAVYLASLGSDASRRTMRIALDTIARLVTDGQLDALSFPWHELRHQHTQAIRAQLAERYKFTTANKHLSALRRVLKECWRLDLMGEQDYSRAVDIENVTGETIPAGRALSSGEIAALLNDCSNDPSPNGARDAALIALLYGCGMRRAEVVALDLADYEPETGCITIRQGKGRKERTNYASKGVAAALADWLALRGYSPGPLLYPTRKGGSLIARRMTTQAAYNILRKRAARAGVADFTPHDLRRSFIGDELDAGADIVTVQHLVGHASPTTTSRYDRRPEDAKRRAVELLNVPYRAKSLRQGELFAEQRGKK